jgi:hypothetical protein
MAVLLAVLALAAAPFAKADSVEAGGYPVLGSSPHGLTLRYIANQPFGIGIVLHNRGRVPVTVVDVRAEEPLGTLVHQIGTRLLAWNPPLCTGNHSCPAFVFLRQPFRAGGPAPLTVDPGRGLGVQLNFRLAGCAAVPLATPASPSRIDVVYRMEASTHVETLALGAARPLLRMPKPSDCAPRPHSDISVTGPWATSSAWAIPGSAGDTCTKTAFTSRWYQAPSKPEVRVVIHFPREVDVVVGIGIHGWTTFHSRYAVVSAHRFHATIVGRGGTTFRAYGAWRCQLR